MAEELPLPPCTRGRIAKPGRLNGRLGTIVGAGPLPGEPPIWYVQADPPDPNPTLRLGRFTHHLPPPKLKGTQVGCNWTLGGLFQMHALEVVTEDGERHPRFEVATPEEAKAHLVACSPPPDTDPDMEGADHASR
jgi:hypothetical protein